METELNVQVGFVIGGEYVQYWKHLLILVQHNRRCI